MERTSGQPVGRPGEMEHRPELDTGVAVSYDAERMASGSTEQLLRTSLYDLHRAAGARMVPFGGWEMPVQYSGILAEHRAVREAAGLFDLSHMGRLYFQGEEGRDLLQWLSTNDVRAVPPGRAQYGLLCNDAAGILDDTVAYNLDEEMLLVVNASNRLKVLAWIGRQRASGHRGELRDATAATTMIGLQGPQAESVLQTLTKLDLPSIRYYAAARGEVAGLGAFVARTGYTGEDGFEIIVSGEDGASLWQTLAERDDPVRPALCGLGSRDTLRLEAGMALYGHELSEESNPYEANLGRVVKLDKGPFVGREALAAASRAPATRRLVGIQMIENAIPRQGYPVLFDDRVVGQITSGTFSPSLLRNVGIAYVATELSDPGTELAVLVREQPRRAAVVPLPHFPHRTRRGQAVSDLNRKPS